MMLLNSIFDMNKMQVIRENYLPTEPCYLGIDVSHGRLDEDDVVALIVAEQKSDGKIYFIDSSTNFINGTMEERRNKIKKLVEQFQLKYNCKILK